MSNKINYIISFVAFVIIFISFFFLVESGDYKNFVIFALAASSFFFGYFIKRKDDDVNKESLAGQQENKKEKGEDLEIPSSKKIPQEFIDEQERYKKLSSEIREKEVTEQ